MVAALLAGLGVVAFGMAALGVFRTGVGWDAGIDTLAAEQIAHISPGTDLRAAYEQVYSTSEFYGVFVQHTASWLRSVLTDGQATSLTGDLSTYRWQAGVTLVTAGLAAAAFGWALLSATTSRLVAAFGFATLMSWPLFFGMSSVDFKDMPVCAGLTLFSSGLILTWKSRFSRSRLIAGVVLASLGASIALSTRIGTWPLLMALALGSIFLYFLAAFKSREFRDLLGVGIATAVAAVASLTSLIALNPFAKIDLLHWLVDSLLVSKAFPVTGVVRFAGADVDMNHLPFSYVPGYFLAQAPILSIAWILISIALITFAIFARRFRVLKLEFLAVAPLLVQGFGLAIAIVLSRSVLYDGVRHLLFVIPALVCVMALGLRVLQVVSVVSPGVGTRAGLLLTPLLVVVLALFADIRWFPYSYAFVNPIASRDANHRDWELDFWGLATLEAAKRFHALGISEMFVLPKLPPQGTAEIVGVSNEATPKEDYGVYVINRGANELPSRGCEAKFHIIRDGHILGTGAICPGSS